MNVSSEYAEQSNATCRRMRPIRFLLFHRSTATAAIILPSAPRPLLPDFWPPMKNSSTSTRPGKFFTILADGAASKFLQPAPSGAVAAKAQKFFEVHGVDP